MLDELEEVLSVGVVAQEVHAVDDEDEGAADDFAAFERDFLEFVEGAFDVEEGVVALAGAFDGEEAADVVFVKFVVEGFSEADAEDIEVGVGFEHADAFAGDFLHCVEQHGGFAGAFLADEEVVVASIGAVYDAVDFGLFGFAYPVAPRRRRLRRLRWCLSWVFPSLLIRAWDRLVRRLFASWRVRGICNIYGNRTLLPW